MAERSVIVANLYDALLAEARGDFELSWEFFPDSSNPHGFRMDFVPPSREGRYWLWVDFQKGWVAGRYYPDARAEADYREMPPLDLRLEGSRIVIDDRPFTRPEKAARHLLGRLIG